MIDPQFTLIVIALFIFSLTVGTISHVILIDVKYMKERGKKSKAFNLIIWMVVVGFIINAPLWWQLYKLMQH